MVGPNAFLFYQSDHSCFSPFKLPLSPSWEQWSAGRFCPSSKKTPSCKKERFDSTPQTCRARRRLWRGLSCPSQCWGLSRQQASIWLHWNPKSQSRPWASCRDGKVVTGITDRIEHGKLHCTNLSSRNKISDPEGSRIQDHKKKQKDLSYVSCTCRWLSWLQPPWNQHALALEKHYLKLLHRKPVICCLRQAWSLDIPLCWGYKLKHTPSASQRSLQGSWLALGLWVSPRKSAAEEGHGNHEGKWKMGEGCNRW